MIEADRTWYLPRKPGFARTCTTNRIGSARTRVALSPVLIAKRSAKDACRPWSLHGSYRRVMDMTQAPKQSSVGSQRSSGSSLSQSAVGRLGGGSLRVRREFNDPKPRDRGEPTIVGEKG